MNENYRSASQTNTLVIAKKSIKTILPHHIQYRNLEKILEQKFSIFRLCRCSRRVDVRSESYLRIGGGGGEAR